MVSSFTYIAVHHHDIRNCDAAFTDTPKDSSTLCESYLRFLHVDIADGSATVDIGSRPKGHICSSE